MLAIKTPERRQWRRLHDFNIDFEQISRIVVVLPSLALNKSMSAW